MSSNREVGPLPRNSTLSAGRKCNVGCSMADTDTFYTDNLQQGPQEFLYVQRTSGWPSPTSSLDSKFNIGFGFNSENLASKSSSCGNRRGSRQRSPQHESIQSRRLSGPHQLTKFNERNGSSATRTRLPGTRRSTCDILPPPVTNKNTSTTIANATLVPSKKLSKVESSLCRQGSGGAGRRKKRQVERPTKQCHDVLKFLSLSREYADSLNCILQKAQELCSGGVMERSSKVKLDHDFVVAERSWLTHIADLLANIRSQLSSQPSCCLSLQDLPPNGKIGNRLDRAQSLHLSELGCEGDDKKAVNFNGLSEVITNRIFCNDMQPGTSPSITSSLLASLLDAICLQASLCHMILKTPEEPSFFESQTSPDHNPSLSTSERGNTDVGHLETDEGEAESNLTRSSSRTGTNCQTSAFTSLEIPQIDLDNLLQPVNKRGADWDAPQQLSSETPSTAATLSKRGDNDLTLMDNMTRYHSYTAPRTALLNNSHSRDADDCINPFIRGNIRQELFSRVRANRNPKRSQSLGVQEGRSRSNSDWPSVEPPLVDRFFSLDDVDLRPTWMKTPRLYNRVMTKLALENQVVVRNGLLPSELHSNPSPTCVNHLQLGHKAPSLGSSWPIGNQDDVRQFYIEWNILGLQSQLDRLRTDSRLVSPEFHPVLVGEKANVALWPKSTPLRMMLIFEFKEEDSARPELPRGTREEVAVGIYFTLAGDIEVSYRLFHGTYLSEKRSHSFRETPWTGVTPTESGIVIPRKQEKGTILTVGLIIDNIRLAQTHNRTKDVAAFTDYESMGTSRGVPIGSFAGISTIGDADSSLQVQDVLRRMSQKDALDSSGDIPKQYRIKTSPCEPQKAVEHLSDILDLSFQDQIPTIEESSDSRFKSHFPPPSVPSEWLRKIFSEISPTLADGSVPFDTGEENIFSSTENGGVRDPRPSNHLNLSSASLSSMSSTCGLPSVLTILSNCGRIVDGSFSFLSETADEIDTISSYLSSRPDVGSFIDG